MTRLLAAIDADPVSGSVVRTAEALLPVLADHLEVITVGLNSATRVGDRDVVRLDVGEKESVAAVILRRAEADDVAGIVVGLRSVEGGPRPAGHVVTSLLIESRVPVVVVPPGSNSDPLHKVLVPLEGEGHLSPRTARLVVDVERRGSAVDTIHVFDLSSVPMYWDHWSDRDLFAAEFGHRYSPVQERTELRVGDVARQILLEAEQRKSTLVVLEWKRRLTLTRARIVRQLLSETPVPLVLIPVLDE